MTKIPKCKFDKMQAEECQRAARIYKHMLAIMNELQNFRPDFLPVSEFNTVREGGMMLTRVLGKMKLAYDVDDLTKRVDALEKHTEFLKQAFNISETDIEIMKEGLDEGGEDDAEG